MNNSDNCCCSRTFVVPVVDELSVKKQSASKNIRFEESEVMFLISDNPLLYLQLGASNQHAMENLIFTIARDSSDLRAHVQRIALQIRLRDESGLYGALVDLFITLGDKGISIRKRMLAQAKEFLTDKHFFLLNGVLERGIRDTDPLPDCNNSVLSRGYIGNNNFIVESASKSHWQQTDLQQTNDSQTDPKQEANDCLSYGQIEEARKILETAVLQEPWREDLQSDLLEIYWATRDLNGCQAMYTKLADKFIPTHYAWIQTVKCINEVVGGA